MTCERCGGVGFEIVSRDGRDFARACECRQALDAAGDDALAACRLPPRYAHCNLKDFEVGNASLRAAYENVFSYCARYPFSGVDEGLGLLLTGNNGVGKTHLAVAALRELVTTKGVRGAFWDFNALIREIKRSYDPETRTTETEVLEPVIATDVLLLDDLGAWKMTDWMIDTLFHILNSRYLEKRVTLITTNFRDADLKTARSASQNTPKEFLVERIGPRIRSRLMEMCLVIGIEGDDRRETQQSGKRVAVLGRAGAAAGRTAARGPQQGSGEVED